MDSSFSPENFYSTNKTSPNVKLLKKEKELKESFFPSHYNPSFTDEALHSCWKVFRSQQQALDFTRTKKGVHVFSFESNSFVENSGQRLFLATRYKEFWHYYIQLKDEMRLHYEVIPENIPCHMYFDIEFEYDLNPTKDGSSMMETFVEHVLSCFSKSGIKCSVVDFLILASNSPSKFSRHVIVRLPGNAAFRNNFEAGRFAGFVCDAYKNSPNLTAQMAGSMEHASLLVRDKSGNEDTFCDLGVYSKNRNFRLYLSSKRQKGYPLRIAPENRYSLSTGGSDWDLHMEAFMASLICNVRDDANLLVFRDKTLTSLDRSSQGESPEDPAVFSGHGPNGLRSGPENSILLLTANRPSRLDDFVNSLICIGGVEGKIYRKSLNRDGSLVSYDIIKNRWCRNIGRFHKSNNVRLVVDIDRRVWYQRCHDPDCKRADYRSQDFDLPRDVTVDEEILSRFDVCSELTDVEHSALDISSEVLADLLDCELTEGWSTTESDCNSQQPRMRTDVLRLSTFGSLLAPSDLRRPASG